MKISISKTKAAILRHQKRPLVIDEIKLPSRLYNGQILVKMIYSGICGSQLGEVDGVKGKDKFLPHLLGHEGIAKVLQTHKNVKKLKKNDIVLLHWMPSTGLNSLTPKYSWNNKVLNAGFVTTFNEHAVVSENRLTKIDKIQNYLNILLLGCTASTAIGSVKKLAKVQKNSNVLVAGCGPIGLYIIKYLKFLKVKNITAIDIDKKKLELAKKYGAKKTILNVKRNRNYNFKKLNNYFDYFFECSGNTNVIELGFQVIKSKGSLILIGVPKYNTKSSFNTLEINLGKKILGSKGGDFNPNKDFNNFAKVVNRKI